MRVAFVTSEYPPDLGGVQVVVSEIARRLVHDGHHVEVFAHASPLSPAGTQRRDGVVVRRFQVPIPSRDFAVSPGLLATLARRRHAFDVVHAHNYHTLPPLGAALAGARPLVLSPYFHGGGHSPAARVAHLAYKPLSRLLFSACAHVICVSDAEAVALADQLPGFDAPVTVIPNAVVARAFSEAPPFAVSANVVLAAGRFEPYKQFDRVALVAETLPADTEIVLLGDGPAHTAVEQLVARHGLQERVRLLGRVSDEDRCRWFRTASAFVSLSKHESFGLTLVEALAAGTPVVASDIPAHRETAVGQPEGAVRLVAEDAAPAQVAETVLTASGAGLPTGVSLASWEDVTRRTLEIYESVRSASTSR